MRGNDRNIRRLKKRKQTLQHASEVRFRLPSVTTATISDRGDPEDRMTLFGIPRIKYSASSRGARRWALALEHEMKSAEQRKNDKARVWPCSRRRRTSSNLHPAEPTARHPEPTRSYADGSLQSSWSRRTFISIRK